MSDQPKKKRGGRREPPGGAPRKGHVRLVCYVQPETRALIDAESARTDETLGQVVDRLLAPIVPRALDSRIDSQTDRNTG